MGIIEIVYIVGFVLGILVVCYEFSQGIKVLGSNDSFMFLLLEAVNSICKLAVWPASLVIFILQLPFGKGVLRDVENAIGNYNNEDDKHE